VLIQDPIHFAISRGIAIPRWRKNANTVTEKDAGCPSINPLGVIHFFEADFNSRLVKQAVKLDLLSNDGQHGSVRNHTNVDESIDRLHKKDCEHTRKSCAVSSQWCGHLYSKRESFVSTAFDASLESSEYEMMVQTSIRDRPVHSVQSMVRWSLER